MREARHRDGRDWSDRLRPSARQQRERESEQPPRSARAPRTSRGVRRHGEGATVARERRGVKRPRREKTSMAGKNLRRTAPKPGRGGERFGRARVSGSGFSEEKRRRFPECADERRGGARHLRVFRSISVFCVQSESRNRGAADFFGSSPHGVRCWRLAVHPPCTAVGFLSPHHAHPH